MKSTICKLILVLCFVASSTAVCAAAPIIRVLTAFDDNALSGFGGDIVRLNTAVEGQIRATNQAFTNSGIYATVVNVGVARFSDSRAADITALAFYAQQNMQLRLRRDALNADVVMVLGYFGYPLGITYNLFDPSFSAANAFAAVDLTLLSQNGYQHEFAHLFGARHQASGGWKNNDPTPGLNHGSYMRLVAKPRDNVPPLCVHTIMAYTPVDGLFEISCTSIPILWYSAPNGVTYGNNWWVIDNFGGYGWNESWVNQSNSGYYNVTNFSNSTTISTNAFAVSQYHNTKIGNGQLTALLSAIANMISPE